MQAVYCNKHCCDAQVHGVYFMISNNARKALYDRYHVCTILQILENLSYKPGGRGTRSVSLVAFKG